MLPLSLYFCLLIPYNNKGSEGCLSFIFIIMKSLSESQLMALFQAEAAQQRHKEARKLRELLGA